MNKSPSESMSFITEVICKFIFTDVHMTFTFTFNNLADAFIQKRRTNEENNRSNQTIERATVYKCHDKSQLV